MPYITTEEVKEKRKAIKKAFPKFKFSITCRNYSTISVTILSAPIDLLEGVTDSYEQVNHYYISDHYAEQPEKRDALLKIQKIMSEGNYIASVDGDYGNIPNFYLDLSIGDWDKPFQFNN